MSFGGDSKQKSTTTTQKVVLSPEQKKLLGYAQPFASQAAKNPPQMYPGSVIPGFNPLQLAGQGMAIEAAQGAQSDLAQGAAGANQFLLGDVLRPESNPALQGYIDAATRPLVQQLTETMLPSIRGTAVATGGVGGSRQGIAEGRAIEGTQRAIGDTTAKIASDAYGRGLDAMTRGLTLTPQTMSATLAPSATMSGVGDIQRQLVASLLGEQAQKFMYNQQLPLMMAREFTSMAGATPGGGSTSTATAPAPQQSPLSTALGIGSLAASLIPGGQMFAPFMSAGSRMFASPASASSLY